MSRRPDIDALTAALLRAVTEARAAQTALEEAARGKDASQTVPSVEAPSAPGAGPPPRPRAIPPALAGASHLAFMGTTSIPPPDSRSRPAAVAGAAHLRRPGQGPPFA